MKLIAGRRLRVLDLDIENRPLSYLGQDFTTAEVTAIACSWLDSNKVEVWLLGLVSLKIMLAEFVKRYDEAEIVTGHYIRKHDLPILNGALLEQGLPPLGPKLTSDTKLDLIKRAGISASQESLAGMYGLRYPKEHMSQPAWREANRLTPRGLKDTRRRVVGDIKQHKELRARLIAGGALSAPRLWIP